MLIPANLREGGVTALDATVLSVTFPVPERFPDKIVVALAWVADQVWFPEIRMSLEIVTLRPAVVLRFVRFPARVKELPPIVTPLVLFVPKVRLPIDRLRILLLVGWLVIVELKVKFPPLVGVPFGDQFVVVFQVELVVPDQVRFCACA